MLPDPLHPAVVHFPLVLATLLPLIAVVALVAIRRGSSTRYTWLVVVAFAVFAAGSAWLAVETGEGQAERVEEVIGDEPVHEHEEAAEWLLMMAGITAVVSGIGLVHGRVGSAARWGTVVLAIVAMTTAVRTGDLGGKLVYQHGAARAYTE